MKSCGNCGRANEDASELCGECRTSFSKETDSGTMRDDLSDSFRQPLPSPVKWTLWLVAWVVVVLATISNDPEQLRGALAFPVGFYGLLPAETSILFAWFGAWCAVVGGWMIYGWLTIAMQLARELRTFSVCYLLFCVLLILNVAGCRHLIETASRIH